MSDDRSVLVLLRLADVSARWGVLIGLLAIALAIRPTRRAATRHWLCAIVLAAGPALAFAPRWGEAVVPWPWTARSAAAPDPVPISTAAPAFDAPPFVPDEPRPAVVPSPRIEPAPPTRPRPFDRAVLLARALVGVWLAGALAMLARLALGAWTLARWKRSAIAPTDGDLAMLAACVAEAPGRRGVRMARHRAVASPVVIGGLRPTILVPGDWDAWPPDLRRAGLRHELAHVRRGDDAFKLAEELIRCPFWFYPLVAWLLGRIDRERELLCDEAAVALGDDPKGLARLLLELSRPGPTRRVPSASLPFFPGRRATAVRIERLLEDDMSRTLSRPSFARTWILGPLALAAVLALGGLRVRTATAQDQPRPEAAAPPAAERPLAPAAESDAPFGRVFDADGRPIAGATVTPTSWRDNHPRSTTTDADGRFALTGLDASRHHHVFIWKEGFVPAWESSPSRDNAGPIKLDRAEPFSAVLVDERGAPIPGAEVRIAWLSTIVPLTAGRDVRQVGFPGEIPGRTLPVPSLATTTAEDGSFSFPHAAADKTTALRLRIETDRGRELATAPESIGMAPGDAPKPGHVIVSPRVKATIRAVPAARLAGRIVSMVPGVEVEGLSVRADVAPSPSQPIASLAGPIRSAMADRDGRFILDDLAPVPFTLAVTGPGRNRLWTTRTPITVEPKPGETTEAILELIPGVQVEGYVFARQTGRPAPGVWVVATQPTTVVPGEDVQTETDADGVFRFRFPPGEIHLRYADSEAGYITPLNGSFRWLTIPEGVARFELPPFQVEATVPARVLVLDADRRPVPGAKVALRSNPREGQLDSSGVTDDAGILQRDRRNGSIVLGERARIHVTPPGGELRKFDLAPAADGLIEIVLPDFRLVRQDGPKALRGLVVDPEGKPLAGAAVTIEDARPDAGAEPARWSLASDARGRFAWIPPKGLGPVRLSVTMPGLAPRSMPLDIGWVASSGQDLRIALGNIGTFGGVLVDAAGEPLAGARVRATLILSPTPTHAAGVETVGDNSTKFVVYASVDPTSDLGSAKEAVTAADGSFTLSGDIPSSVYEAKLEAHAADGTQLSIRRSVALPPAGSTPTTRVATNGLHSLAPGERPRLTAVPSARIEGKVESEVPGLDLTTLVARINMSGVNPQPEASVDRQGRFAFEALDDWPVQVVLAGPGVHASWTSSPVRVDPPAPGSIVPVAIRVIPGVEVRGRLVGRGAGGPVEGVLLDVWSSAAPIGGPLRIGIDAEGRYAVRLLPGETTIAVCHPGERFVGLKVDAKTPFRRRAGVLAAAPPPAHFARKEAQDPKADHHFVPVLTASAAQFTIPEGVATFNAPNIEVAPAVTLHGRLLAADGKPIAEAMLSTRSDRPYITVPLMIDAVMTRSDDRGAFRFRPGAGTVEIGHAANLVVVRPGRTPQTVPVTPDADGFVEVVVPDEAAASPGAMKGELNGFILGPAVTPAGR